MAESSLTPPPAAPKRRRWKWIVLGVVGLLVLFGIIGVIAGGDDKNNTETVDATATTAVATGAPGAAASATNAPATTARPTTTIAPTTTVPPTTTTPGFGSGIKLVGSDLQPGRYITANVSACYWQRLSGVSGDFKEILANDNVDGQAIVDIQAGDVAFQSQRCGRWTPYQAPSAPATTFGEGYWVVGEQIAAGRYRSSGASSCYWQRLRGFSGNFNDLIANDNVSGEVIVDVKATDAGFASARCGTWTKV